MRKHVSNLFPRLCKISAFLSLLFCQEPSHLSSWYCALLLLVDFLPSLLALACSVHKISSVSIMFCLALRAEKFVALA